MTDETIVVVYETCCHAELAAQDVKALGIPERAISVHVGGDGAPDATRNGTTHRQGFWANLFGGEPDHDTTIYDRSIASGSTILTVKAPEVHVARVIEILESYAPIDIDELAANYSQSLAVKRQAAAGSAPATAPAVAAYQGIGGSDLDSIQIAEKRMSVGNRLVNRGGTRIRRFVVETVIEEQVPLLDRKGILEQHPVSRRPADERWRI